ncbi:Nuclear transport factor 2 Eukaryote [Penicillium sp. IBT 35674x]|nr:Nuclear transport factor 2 Eukaryote [Penicillium sp. IBT 35674x]
MGDFSAIGNAFVAHYFKTFDNYDARATLANLYRPESMLIWEDSKIQGTQEIIAKITKPDLKIVKTQINSTDSEPSIDNAILARSTITKLQSLAKQIDNALDKSMSFTETFLLAPIPGQPGGFYIHNQIFRLIMG